MALPFLNHLTEQTVTNAVTLERYLLLAQDVPGETVHAVLQPSVNRASPLTGPIETLSGLSLNRFTEFGGKPEISLYHSWPNSQTFGRASFEAFVGSSGLRVQIHGDAGASVPTGPLAQLGYHGVTQVLGAKASYPVIRSRRQTFNVFEALDTINTLIDTNGGAGGPSVLISYESLCIARTGADRAFSDLLGGTERPAVNAVFGRLSKGMDVFGNVRKPPTTVVVGTSARSFAVDPKRTCNDTRGTTGFEIDLSRYVRSWPRIPILNGGLFDRNQRMGRLPGTGHPSGRLGLCRRELSHLDACQKMGQ